MPWFHESPIPGHPVGADLDPSALANPAKFDVVGDFDGDGQDEIAICIDAPGSGGNDHWILKFNKATGQWAHFSPIAGHPLGADLDPSALANPAKFDVVGDFEASGSSNIAICLDAPGSEGNDHWVMDFGLVSPELATVFTGTAVLSIADSRFAGPFNFAITDCATFFRGKATRAVSLARIPPFQTLPFSTVGTLTDIVTVTQTAGGQGILIKTNGSATLTFNGMEFHFAHSLSFVGPSDATFNLTTGAATPIGPFAPAGIPLACGAGGVTLVGTATFSGGFLAGIACSIVITGVFPPSLLSAAIDLQAQSP